MAGKQLPGGISADDFKKVGRRLMAGILVLVLGFPLVQTACDPATLARMQGNVKGNLEQRVEELPEGDRSAPPAPQPANPDSGPCVVRAC